MARVALLVCSLGFGWVAVVGAAQLFARRMEVVRLPEGQATIFRDSVVITDDPTRIEANVARLYDHLGLAVISESVRIESPDADIQADSAFYYLNERRAELYGNVRVRRESLDIAAPTIRYLADSKLVEARDGVTLVNRDGRFRLTGQRGNYDLAGDSGVVDRSPLLVWHREGDSARVTSREMVWNERESRAVARGNVRLYSGASEVSCDTIVYLAGPDSGLAIGGPTVRDSVSRAGGDSLSFRIRDGALQEVLIAGRASGEYRTRGGERVEVAGQTIRIEFDRGAVERITVTALGMGRLIRTGENE